MTTIEEIRRKYNLSLILLHGSQVTGKIHRGSDTDIAVIREKTDSKIDLLALTLDIGKVLKSGEIDITDATNANPLLLYNIARKNKLLSGKKSDFEKFIRLAFTRYSDYLPYLKKEADFVKQKLATYANN